ncbi:MAG: hypothetical protein ACYC65_07870 [Candidatus Limnocylindrales bacterium]
MRTLEFHLAEIAEREALVRSIGEASRARPRRARSIRSRLGESLIRLGQRVAGESHSSPVLTG